MQMHSVRVKPDDSIMHTGRDSILTRHQNNSVELDTARDNDANLQNKLRIVTSSLKKNAPSRVDRNFLQDDSIFYSVKDKTN